MALSMKNVVINIYGDKSQYIEAFSNSLNLSFKEHFLFLKWRHNQEQQMLSLEKMYKTCPADSVSFIDELEFLKMSTFIRPSSMRVISDVHVDDMHVDDAKVLLDHHKIKYKTLTQNEKTTTTDNTTNKCIIDVTIDVLTSRKFTKLGNIYSRTVLPVKLLTVAKLLHLSKLLNLKVIYLSRDGYSMHKLHVAFINVLKDKDTLIMPEYMYFSRIAASKSSRSFVNYVKNIVTKDSIIVDGVATGRTFNSFCKKHNITFGEYVVSFPSMKFDHEVSSNYNHSMQLFDGFNLFSSVIERFLYANHGSVVDVDDDAQPECIDIEYNEEKFKEYHDVVEFVSEHVLNTNIVMEIIRYSIDVEGKTMLKFTKFTKEDFDYVCDALDHTSKHGDYDETLQNVEIDVNKNSDDDAYNDAYNYTNIAIISMVLIIIVITIVLIVLNVKKL